MVRKVIIAVVLLLGLAGVSAPPVAATSAGSYCGHDTHYFWRGSHWHGLSYNSGHWAKVWYIHSFNDLYGHVHEYNVYEYHNGRYDYSSTFRKRC